MDILPILYTYQLRGDLTRLPRLHTFLRQLALDMEQAHQTKALVLDLGESCAPESWHCTATDGRSMLLALDAMGYHAAHVTGMAEASRQRLTGQVSLGLVDAAHVWRFDVPPLRDEGIIISSLPAPALRLNIRLMPAPHAELTQGTLQLPAVTAGEVGSALVNLRGEPSLMQHTTYAMPTQIRPDATITAAIDFIQDEARLL
jgi:hypothetical protein